MKRKLTIIFAAVVIIALLAACGSNSETGETNNGEDGYTNGIGDNVTPPADGQNGDFEDLEQERTEEDWVLYGYTANGYIFIHQEFSQRNLHDFSVVAGMDAGEMTLVITQDEAEKTIVIYDGIMLFAGDIDMSEFNPGLIRLELRFDAVENFFADIEWCGCPR